MVTTQEKLKEMHQCAGEQPCVCFNIRRAARVITAFYDEALKPVGLRSSQLGLMGIVTKMGPLTIGLLAEATCTDRTTLTRNLRPLEREGYLKVLSGSADRREKEVVITQKGKETLQSALPIWQAVQKKIHQKLGLKRCKQLMKALCGVVKDIEKL